MKTRYEIQETKCYPNKYKVIALGFRADNAAYLYFKTKEEAQTYIDGEWAKP